MPELPEVQTVINGLKPEIINEEILEIVEHREDTVELHHGDTRDEYGRIKSIDRRGKYIIINTTSCKLLIHLRMTGKLIFTQDLNKSTTHNRAEIFLSGDKKIIFDDIRTFGTICVFDPDQSTHKVENLGIEPLSQNFTAKKLGEILAKRSAPIKNALLNQKIIAGLGNIYACESLYRSGISPLIPANSLSKQQLTKLKNSIVEVLNLAIANNGTTVSDYRTSRDKKGTFQNMLNVYKKDNCPQGHKIKKVKQAGRSTYFCPVCQK